VLLGFRVGPVGLYTGSTRQRRPTYSPGQWLLLCILCAPLIEIILLVLFVYGLIKLGVLLYNLGVSLHDEYTAGRYGDPDDDDTDTEGDSDVSTDTRDDWDDHGRDSDGWYFTDDGQYLITDRIHGIDSLDGDTLDRGRRAGFGEPPWGDRHHD
jgi:hypothetical protein